LGAGRTAVEVRVGLHHTCALLVRFPNGKLEGGDLRNKAIGTHNLKATSCYTSVAATEREPPY
jgi:hypothetical protein